MKRNKNFTLVEIIIVVAVIVILATIAIPNLLRTRVTTQEAVAAAAMKTILTAEIYWRASHSNYTGFNNLSTASPNYLDASFFSSAGIGKQGYFYNITVVNPEAFYVTANSTRGAIYYIDSSGALCRADANSPIASGVATTQGNCSTVPGGGTYSQVE